MTTTMQSNETLTGRAATHYGHCQVCGSVQKLPKGRLSLHGYTLEYGFFNGTCLGSRHLPIELSKDLVEGAIARAQAEAITVRAEQQALRTQVDAGTTAWVHVYENAGYHGGRWVRGCYRWIRVQVTAAVMHAGTEREYVTYSYAQPAANGEPAKERRIETYEAASSYAHPGATPEQLRQLTVLTLNTTYADGPLQRELDMLTRYVAWQRERIATWHARPLLPVKPKKDTEAFAVEPK